MVNPMRALVKIAFQLLPNSVAAYVVDRLIQRPIALTASQQQLDWLASGTKFNYGDQQVGWCFGEGPCVILVHGWGGRAAQWQHLATALVRKGFSVVVPDIAGHGESVGSRISFRLFGCALKKLIEYLDCEIYAIIGHSAGGLGMMAARWNEGVDATKYICLAAPSHPYPPIKTAQRRLGLRRGVASLLEKKMAYQFNCNWHEITQCSYQRENDAELLLIYDNDDRYIGAGDAETILNYWPEAKLVTTEKLGHEGLLYDPECADRIGDFLSVA